jgi:hypothetical protein
MTLAEKHYRMTYRIKPEEKLTNDQWKIVNMMHRCLKENNMPKLPHGTILVNKKQLVEHLGTIKICLNATDKLMEDTTYKEFSKGEGGSKLAKIWNALNFTMQSIEHFQLNIPFKK